MPDNDVKKDLGDNIRLIGHWRELSQLQALPFANAKFRLLWQTGQLTGTAFLIYKRNLFPMTGKQGRLDERSWKMW